MNLAYWLATLPANDSVKNIAEMSKLHHRNTALTNERTLISEKLRKQIIQKSTQHVNCRIKRTFPLMTNTTGYLSEKLIK